MELVWILKHILVDFYSEEERQNIVEAFVENSELRHLVYNDHLRRIPDFQRLAKKFQKKNASLQDCYRVYEALRLLPVLLESLESRSGKHNGQIKELFCNPLKVG